MTPETLDEWRKDAETDPDWREARRIIALLDALTAEKAAREEAQRKAKLQEGNAAAAAAMHRLVNEAEARADKAEQERDEAREYAEGESASRVALANRVTELQNLLRFDQSDLRDAVESLEAAEARVAALEAGINALADLWGDYAAACRIGIGDRKPHRPHMYWDVAAKAVRALTEKGD